MDALWYLLELLSCNVEDVNPLQREKVPTVTTASQSEEQEVDRDRVL